MKKLIAVCSSVLLLMVAFYFVFRSTGGDVQPLPIQDGVEIISISRITKQGETVTNDSISGDEIGADLSAALLDHLRNASMTARPISAPGSLNMTEAYDHISLWLQKADSSTFRINLSSEKGCSNVEEDGTYFGINDPAPLLQEAAALLDGKT